MKSPLVLLIPVLLALTIPGCESHKAEPKPQQAPEAEPPGNSEKKQDQPKLVNEFLIEGDSVSYNGYDIAKLEKEVYDRDWCAPGRVKPCRVPVRYTTIKRNGKVLAEFDDFHYGLGNGNDVALYPLLGGNSKQLIISQTGPRSGRHYIVELGEKPRVIFDSEDYEVGREWVWLLDVDNDGTNEISLLVTSFYMVFDIPMAGTPLPRVIFKYDRESKRYLPANHLFQAYLLERVEERRRIRQQNPKEGPSELDTLMDYIYAGKEKEGWDFFEREYDQPDKETIKPRTIAVLKKSPAYQYIRKHRIQ